MAPTTIPDALAAALAGDASRPLVTHLGAGGMRSELSVRTFENNAAKAANLLRDDGLVEPGTRVALALPLHWQTSVWLCAAAMTGAIAWIDGPGDDPSVEVSIVDADGLGRPRAPLTLATSLHPLGLPFITPLPEGVLDLATEVRAHGDRFTPFDVVEPDSPWVVLGDRAWSHATALADARDLARDLGAGSGARVLCARPLDPVSLLALLALPLAIGGSVVLLTDPDTDVDEVATTERCDAVLR